MVPASTTLTTTTTLQGYHFLALRKAIAADDTDRATGRNQPGWRAAPEVHGWRVADELVALDLFERNIKGQSSREDLNIQRYRITAAGRAAYRAAPAESNILSNLWTAINEAVQGGNSAGGWVYWKSIASDWRDCDSLVGKGWTQPDLRSGPQRKGIGDRKYRITAEGCRMLDLPYPPDEGKKELPMNETLELGQRIFDGKRQGNIIEILANGNVRMMDDLNREHSVLKSDIKPLPVAITQAWDQDDDEANEPDESPADWTNRYVDPDTGEIIEVTPVPPADHSTDAGEMVADLQINSRKESEEIIILKREKYELQRQLDAAKIELDKATALPNPGEFRNLQTRAEEQRKEINRLVLEKNRLESNGNAAQVKRLQQQLEEAQQTINELRQPSLETIAQINHLTDERDQLQQKLSLLQTTATSAPTAAAAPAAPEIEITFLLGNIFNTEQAAAHSAKLVEKLQDGWHIAYEIIQHGGTHYVRLERYAPQPAATPTDTGSLIDLAIEQALESADALSIPRSDVRRVQPDQMLIIGLVDEPADEPAPDPFLAALRAGITDPAQLAAIGNTHLMNVAAESYQRATGTPFQSRPLSTVKT